jgi:diketogulonate reductase-like aldo/keto reductase
MSSLSITSTLPLPSSTKIPQIGFGVYLSPTSVCTTSCAHALRAGYRHIDTAQYYANEASVGEAVRASGLKRSDIFLTTKILSAGADLDATYASIVESVEKLDGKDGYVDLFLIHSPNGGAKARKLMWTALEKAKEAGKVREIGVSNYAVEVLEELKEFAKVWPPAVDQVEVCTYCFPCPNPTQRTIRYVDWPTYGYLPTDTQDTLANASQLHPWCQQRELVDFCKQNNIVVQAYCPLVRNEKAQDATLLAISKKHGVSANQVLVRWSLQKGWVPLPKSDTPERIVSNADVYGFELDKEDMEKLDQLDQGADGALVQVASGKRE